MRIIEHKINKNESHEEEEKRPKVIQNKESGKGN